MKKILITGSTGLLGSRLVFFLKNLNFKVFTHGRNTTECDFDFDLEDFSLFDLLLKKTSPDIIINLVALTNVDECEENPSLAFRSNCLTAYNLVSSIKKNHNKFFTIHISTDHIYDNSILSKENDINIKNMYAYTKYFADLTISNIPSAIIRTNFFGKSYSKKNSFSDWIYKSLKEGESIHLIEDIFFSPISITTLNEMILKIIEFKTIGIFNVGSRDGMSKYNFGVQFSKLNKLPYKKIQKISFKDAQFYKYNRPIDMRMNVDKFEKNFNITMPSLEYEIQRASEDYRNE